MSREQRRAYDRAGYRARRNSNHPLKRSYTSEGQLEIRRSHPREVLYAGAKTRAKKRGLAFDIEVSDIVIPKYCPYLGIEITLIKGSGYGVLSNASLDRIDPAKGYVKGNVQVISRKANLMKNDADINELVQFARNVLKAHEKEVSK